jgi:hypothetical protein
MVAQGFGGGGGRKTTLGREGELGRVKESGVAGARLEGNNGCLAFPEPPHFFYWEHHNPNKKQEHNMLALGF